MGITGLIPFLSKSSRRANIKEYAGQTVAIDAYCWLHKGAFSCADKLVMNEPTVMYVSYCMKFINMLLSHNIKPILVFDGRYLPAKAETEKKRKESRAKNRQKGAELMRAGFVDEGRNFLRRSLDITHEMALNLIRECRSKNIDCIVAPHEADAELAYLNVKNIAQIVITEDSDLLLFGCIKVLFKMDINGNGLLIEKDRLHLSLGVRHDIFSLDKFRQMCILSGCDYLPSLPGIGLSKARKFIDNVFDENTSEALLKLPAKLKMWSLVVTEDYKEAFIEAEKTFKYQLVYDPIKRKQVPLNGTEDENNIIGEKLDEYVAFQLAIGNLDPVTLNQMDSYDPDKVQLKHHINNVTSHSSIWSKNFSPRVNKPKNCIFPFFSSTKGLTVETGLTSAVKRSCENDSSPEPEMTKEFLRNLYSSNKKQCPSEKNTNEETLPDSRPDNSPILFRKKNPFVLQSPSNSSTKKRCLGGLARFKLDFESSELLESRYFVGKESGTQSSPKKQPSVLDKFGENERFSEKTDIVESQHEGIKVDYSVGLIPTEDSYHELDKSTTEIQRKLLKVGFAGENNLKNDPEDDEIKSSQEENLLNHSCSETNSADKNKRVSLLNCFNRDKKTILTPLNRVFSVKSVDNSLENCDNAQISPYFGQKSEEKVTLPAMLTSLRLPTGPTNNVSVMRSTKKTPRSTASKCNQGKQQTLLTNFGFQPRPKLQSEKT